jgi:hypothetical protein
MLRDASLIVFVFIISVCVLGGVASSKFLGPDNYIEETAEMVIEDQIGLDIDLSPSSPEPDPQ